MSADQDTSQTPQDDSAAVANHVGDRLAGKYLTFELAGEEYGVEILRVIEIIGFTDVTEVPQTPPFVKGVINLRGKVIPVVDLRLRFGLEEVEYDRDTCIIVIDTDHNTMGIIVDNVSEVLDMSADQIEEAPSLGSAVDTSSILGLGKTGNKVCILLDIASVIDSGSMVST